MKFGKSMIIFLSMALLAGIVSGAKFEAGDTVSIEETVEENLYVAAGEVRVNSIVKGDLIVAGGQLEFNDIVTEDLTAAGGQVDVNNNVQGDARIAGGQITIDSAVNDLVVMGGDIKIREGTVVNGDAAVTGGSINIKGSYNRNLKVAAGMIDLDAVVAGNVELEAGSIRISRDTQINGNLTYTLDRELDIPEGQVKGSVKRLEPERKAYNYASSIFFKFAAFIGLLFIGLVWIAIMPHFFENTEKALSQKYWKSTLWGLIFLVVVPAALILIMLTIVGIPIAVLGFILYGLSVYLSRVVFARWLGGRLYKRGRFLKFIIGLVLLSILVWIPFIGWLLHIFAVMAGIGAVTQIKRKKKRRK
ncbi:hypothetical protein GF323_03245 [Candidatus Woesearchaeota archaeon]|nr:hypothetical protein [Candidatus Woesearchaeota archaeon]